MPLPTPGPDETEQEFITRCAGNSTMVQEYPKQNQRLAVCHSQWRKKHEAKMDSEHEPMEGMG